MSQRSEVVRAALASAPNSRLAAAHGGLSRRRLLGGVAGLGLAGVGVPLLAGCQLAPPKPGSAAKLTRIGVLSIGHGPEMPEFKGLRQGLRELGYVEGQNIAFEYRFVQGRFDLLPPLAAELVGLKIDLIVPHGIQACQAAKEATTTIPIVFGTGADPVALGFAASLARPGGNMTGLVHSPAGLNAKRLQLLTDAAPGIRRVGVLMRPANAAHARNFAEAQGVAGALGVQVQPVEVHDAGQLEAAFEAAASEGLDGLVALPDALFFELRTRITALTTKTRLAGVFQELEFAQAGGLMSYGVNIQANFRRAAVYVDKILKGAPPAGLPIEQPAKFDFVVNLKTAGNLGLAVPPAVLEQVTEVIA